jgi:hypothetical protein
MWKEICFILLLLNLTAVTGAEKSEGMNGKDGMQAGISSPSPATDRPMKKLLNDWRKFKVVPILQYGWGAPKTEEERKELFEDYLKMGFTGVYKVDRDPEKAGRLFLLHNMHGFMPEIQFYGPGEPTLNRDGKPQAYRRKHPYTKSIFSPVSRDNYYQRALNTVKDYGPENLFTCGDTLLMSSWDETGLYTREGKEYGYGAKEEFIGFLRDVIFKDEFPDKDTNKDGRTLNRETKLSIKDWQEVTLPVFEERYKQSGLWKYWVDFHAYYTYMFFRRGSIYIGDHIGKDVELWTFSHGSVKWPGAASTSGIDQYWASRLNRILTVEDCQGDYPGSTIHYSFTDHLSRRYGLPVIGWSWFWPDPERSKDPGAIGRALARAMGHNTHGLIFWVYQKAGWDQKPEAKSAVAHWHHIYQAHWDFLKGAERPVPDVAVVRSRNTGNMYNRFDYPKLDFGWTCQSLTESHIPFEVVSSNHVEIEPEILSDYKVLLIPTATWEGPLFREAVVKFLKSGGYVYTDGDSFLLDTVTGGTTSFLASYFGIRPAKKYKGLVHPTYDSPEEYGWFTSMAEEWQTPEQISKEKELRWTVKNQKPLMVNPEKLALLRKGLPSVSGTGLKQYLWDPGSPQWITAENKGELPESHRTYHDIVTGQPLSGAKVLALYGTEVCAVETEKTVWTGFRPGFDHAYTFPVDIMLKWGEKIWPFEINTATTARERTSSRQWITKILEKAGVKPPVEVFYKGESAPHVEVIVRQNRTGDSFIFVINHEDAAGEYLLKSRLFTSAEAIGELRNGLTLKTDAAGGVSVNLHGGDVAIIAAGSGPFVQARISAHKNISR